MASLGGDATLHARHPMPLHATARQRYGGRSDWNLMTSEERREARYRRRVARRAAKRAKALEGLDDYEMVFSYAHLYQSHRRCRRNVAWKASVQRYMAQAPLMVMDAHDRLMTGRFRPTGFYEFDLCERGKMRHIRSVGIRERVVQRCLCDYSLVPALSRTFIYDNGASLPDKGYSFSIERLRGHLMDHYRRHGTEGYVLLFDLSKFFDSIPHELAKGAIAKEISDPRLIGISDALIDAYEGDRGLGLGSQISQILALDCLNRLDHFIKERLRIRGYGRYMDDGYLIHESKERLRECLSEIRTICSELGVTLNEKKTQIVKLSHGFTFLKVRHWLLPSGRVLRKPGRGSASRMRKRLRAFRQKVDSGIMTEKDVWQSFQSWRSYVSRFDAHRTIVETERLCVRLFGPEPNGA